MNSFSVGPSIQIFVCICIKINTFILDINADVTKITISCPHHRLCSWSFKIIIAILGRITDPASPPAKPTFSSIMGSTLFWYGPRKKSCVVIGNRGYTPKHMLKKYNCPALPDFKSSGAATLFYSSLS